MIGLMYLKLVLVDVYGVNIGLVFFWKMFWVM